MRKHPILITAGCVYLAILLYGIGHIYSNEAPAYVAPPSANVPLKQLEGKISIAHTELFGYLERPQVVFDHTKHVETLSKENPKTWETCGACHLWGKDSGLMEFVFPGPVAKPGRDAWMNAYHDKCQGCHKERISRNLKAGPVACGACHKEQLAGRRYAYPAMVFSFAHHDGHDKKLKERGLQESCSYCHHLYDALGKQLVSERGKEWSCGNCHAAGANPGPVVAAAAAVVAGKGLGLEKVSHERCLSCHLYYRKAEAGKVLKQGEKPPPVECVECHTGVPKTVADLEKVPRPDSGQTEMMYFETEAASLKGVAFNHKSHLSQATACKECHHQTTNACRECHTLYGSADGGGINLAGANHDLTSMKSCSGCHARRRSNKKCAGCHDAFAPVDAQVREPSQVGCAICHSGKRELLPATKLTVAGLDPEKVKKEVEIKFLEKEYEPAKFPHQKVLETMTKISNEDKLASYFHRDIQTLCDGCHHQRQVEAESKKDAPPYCRNCHSVGFDPRRPDKPRLLASYHRQCVQCHLKMELEKPKECKECHKEKQNRPAAVLSQPAQGARRRGGVN